MAAQAASFQLGEGYAINLFADESMGIANPVCFRWDAEGRLWVLCSWAYPQLKPGEPADDKLFILEDKDQDGKADKVSVFADGLNMPTGFALGHGGVYLAEGPDLMHLRDTDGDGKADQSEVLFTSGFGTGDTHRNINSLTWSGATVLLSGSSLLLPRADTVGHRPPRRTRFLATASVASPIAHLPPYLRWWQPMGICLWRP